MLKKEVSIVPEISVSLDPAIDAGNLTEYLAEVNTWPDVTIHFDLADKSRK